MGQPLTVDDVGGSITLASPRLRVAERPITGGTLRASPLANNASTGSTSLVGANGPSSNGTLTLPGLPAVLRFPRAMFSLLCADGFDDARNILERASARETAARVAAGALASEDAVADVLGQKFAGLGGMIF